MLLLLLVVVVVVVVSRDSSVGIATHYRLDGTGIETRWGWDFPRPSSPVLGTTRTSVQWVPGLSRELSGRGVALTTHPLLAPMLKKEYSYTYFPWGHLWHVLGWTLRFVVVVAAAVPSLLLHFFQLLFLHYKSSAIYWRSWYCLSRRPIKFMALGGG